MTLQKLLHRAALPAVRAPLCLIVGVVAFWPGLGAAQNALTPPLTLIFDEVLQETVLSNPFQRVEPPASAAPSTEVVTAPWPPHAEATRALAPAGLLVFTLGGAGMGAVPAVSTDILRTQVSESMSTLLGSLRLGNR